MDNIGPHILSDFDQQLSELRENILNMGRLSRSQVENAVRGLIERKLDLCNTAIAEDDGADEYELQIDKTGMGVLLKYRPVASDLRLVLASLSISRNLERISDHAVSIAKRAKKILKSEQLDECLAIEPLHQTADGLIADSVKAFYSEDAELASQLQKRNAAFSKEVKKVVKSYTRHFEANMDDSLNMMHLIFICRSLQRVGDLSVNISEDVVFRETAENPKHSG